LRLYPFSGVKPPYLLFVIRLHLTSPTLFPYTTLFRSAPPCSMCCTSPSCAPPRPRASPTAAGSWATPCPMPPFRWSRWWACALRSEEHTSELQSREKLVCRLLLEKKKLFSKLISPTCS